MAATAKAMMVMVGVMVTAMASGYEYKERFYTEAVVDHFNARMQEPRYYNQRYLVNVR